VLFLLPRPARGHTPGLSVADFDVRADGQVEGRLTFASAEQLGGLSLDRDGDGAVTDDDLAAAREDLRAFVLQGVGVDADGATCPAAFLDAELTEADGLLLRTSYACPSDAADIEVTLYYLSGTPEGRPGRPSYRRGIARIEAPDATMEAVLTGEHRAIALHRTGKGGVGRRNARRAAVLVVAAMVVALLAYGSYRWRSARAAWQNPTL